MLQVALCGRNFFKILPASKCSQSSMQQDHIVIKRKMFYFLLNKSPFKATIMLCRIQRVLEKQLNVHTLAEFNAWTFNFGVSDVQKSSVFTILVMLLSRPPTNCNFPFWNLFCPLCMQWYDGLLFLTCPLYKWSTWGFSQQHGTLPRGWDEITVNISSFKNKVIYQVPHLFSTIRAQFHLDFSDAFGAIVQLETIGRISVYLEC